MFLIPKDNLTDPKAIFSSTSFASKTCEGSTDAVEQAEPLDAIIPLKSNEINIGSP